MQPRLELGDLRHDFNEMKQLLVHLSKESQKELLIVRLNPIIMNVSMTAHLELSVCSIVQYLVETLQQLLRHHRKCRRHRAHQVH
jgi:hypothetical protein